MKDRNFVTPVGSVSYRILDKNDNEFFLASNINYSNPIIIDYVEVDDQNLGHGKKMLLEFLLFIKTQQFDFIYLFVDYNLENYAKPKYDSIEGLKKLVAFYESLGFECLNRPEYGEGYQIDMYLLLE